MPMDVYSLFLDSLYLNGVPSGGVQFIMRVVGTNGGVASARDAVLNIRIKTILGSNPFCHQMICRLS